MRGPATTPPATACRSTRVNPAYDLVDLRPDGFEPQVTGLEWDGDDLLVLTWGGNGNDQGNVELGEVYRLSGVTGRDRRPPTSPAPRSPSGLKEPQGIKVVDGEIYVSEKTGSIKLHRRRTPTASSQSSEDDRHVARSTATSTSSRFGLLYKDGNFYVNLSVSINLGGATTVPQGSPDRGTQHHDRQGRPARSTTSPAACAPRTASAGVPRARSS